jgi:hypothetical protein
MFRRILLRAGTLVTVVAVSAIASIAGGADGPAQAGPGTQVFFTPMGRTNPEPILAFVNGPTQNVDVRVANVNNANGLGSFEFTATYDTTVATATVVTLGPFLGSTGRAVNCTTPTFVPAGTVNVSCNTLAASPNGPLGSGVLATITFQPAAVPGLMSTQSPPPLGFSKTHLTDITGDVPISHTALVGTFRTAKCGDFDGNGAVTISDILALIQKFGTSVPPTDPKFDLDGNNIVDVQDLLIEVAEFGRTCTP